MNLESFKQDFYNWPRRQHLSSKENEKIANWWVKKIEEACATTRKEMVKEVIRQMAEMLITAEMFMSKNDEKAIEQVKGYKVFYNNLLTYLLKM